MSRSTGSAMPGAVESGVLPTPTRFNSAPSRVQSMSESDDAPSTGLSPEAAFAVLGDETRLAILLALGRADDPLAFSALFDRVEYDTTANFSYHLEKLLGHFVRETDDGYALRRVGERVVEAVLSGAVTESPSLDRTPVDEPCFRCGGTMEVSYREEAVGLYCPDCGGTRGSGSETAAWSVGTDGDILGHVYLPPAGVRDRSPAELLGAAEVWSVAAAHARSRGVCPRCSAPVEHEIRVCDDHDAGDGRCETCDQRFAVTVLERCRNCIFAMSSIATIRLLASPELMRFMIDHGVDPMAPEGFHVSNLEREVVDSRDPFEARFTFTADDETITLTVDDDLEVTATSRQPSGPVLETAIESD